MKLILEHVMPVLAGILIGMLIGGAINNTKNIHRLKQEAIQRGHAEYNPTNGAWQWKGEAK
jgi:hypothetical protein